jgi:hypothetical protein
MSEPWKPCLECSAHVSELMEKLRRRESALKRTQADLEHLKSTGRAARVEASEEIAAEMPDPDNMPEKTDPTQRYVKRPPLV